MNKIEHNIEREKNFIDLFGYSLVGPDNSNRWIIKDGEIDIGFIQYKKLCKGNKKKFFLPMFGYVTNIESKDIIYKHVRAINDQKGNIVEGDYEYEFDIKANDDNMHVEMSTSKFPGITIWSTKYGFSNFKISSDGLYLEFRSHTENFNTSEILIYKNNEALESYQNKEYIYELIYCDKSVNINSESQKGVSSRQIMGTCSYAQKSRNEMELRTMSTFNNRIRKETTNIINGTIEELALKNEMGFNALNHYRFLVNQLIPFKEDVIEKLCANLMGKREDLAIFIPELGVDEEQIELKLKK